MPPTPLEPAELSPWWGRVVVFTLVFGFSVLILIAATTYRNAPPIPDRAVTPSGAVLFTSEDIARGQEVFLKYGLMANGSVWGHGAYLGPDFTASYLHDLAVDQAEHTARARFGRSYEDLGEEDKGAVGGIVATRLKKNTYDPSTGVLTLAVGDHGFFDREQARWARYFEQPAMNGGLRRNAITDPAELKALNAFFAWATWATVAERPGGRALRAARRRRLRQPARRMGRHSAVAADALVLDRPPGLGISRARPALQVLLLVELSLWFWLLYQTVKPCFADPIRRPFAKFLLLAAAAIPIFYVPALFFTSRSHFAIVDMWRFWIAHLWLEGFFELFVTVTVSIIFYQLALVRRISALRTIDLDLILYFAGGVIGTGHHHYFSGQTNLNMALAASFSALEVAPLTLISLEAWPFIKMMRLQDEPVARHKWTFYFLMSVGFWNFLGAGVFGFLINLPIVSYFEIGTILTTNHAHTAMMGVFGMLSVGLMAFIVREAAGDEAWPSIAKYFRVAFWGLNGGLAAMFLLSLFPAGFMQLMDVAENGCWHARSLAYTGSYWPQLFEWFRLPGDVVFIFFGALPVVVGVLIAYAGLWTRRPAALPSAR